MNQVKVMNKNNLTTLDLSQCTNQEWENNLKNNPNSPAIYSPDLKTKRKTYKHI